MQDITLALCWHLAAKTLGGSNKHPAYYYALVFVTQTCLNLITLSIKQT